MAFWSVALLVSIINHKLLGAGHHRTSHPVVVGGNGGETSSALAAERRFQGCFLLAGVRLKACQEFTAALT